MQMQDEHSATEKLLTGEQNSERAIFGEWENGRTIAVHCTCTLTIVEKVHGKPTQYSRERNWLLFFRVRS
jgi:hypothetical protein